MSNKKANSKFDEDILHLQRDYKKILNIKNNVKPNAQSLRITIIYLVFGVLWILLSDNILLALIQDNELYRTCQLYKGWFYMLYSGMILYFFIRRKLLLYKKTIDKVLKSYEDLNIAHEEIVAMNEELDQQNCELEDQRNALTISDQRYRLVIEGASDGIWDWDIITNEFFFSLKHKLEFGYGDNEIENTLDGWKSLFYPGDWDKAHVALSKYFETKDEIYECTYRIRCKSGEYRWVNSRGKGVWDSEGRPIRIAGSHTDITEHVLLRDLLSEEKELSENIILDAPIIIIQYDTTGNIIKFNPYAQQILGYSEKEVIGLNVSQVLFSDGESRKDNDIFKIIFENDQLIRNEIEVTCKDGSRKTVLWYINTLHDSLGTVKGIVSIGLDISERRELENKLHSLAYYDTLTGIPNRVYFRQEVVRALKNKQKTVLVNIDIDNFKHINDTMGHSAGDFYVRHVAEILAENIAQPNIIARISGDSFAILFVEDIDRKKVLDQLELILNQIRVPWRIRGQSFFNSVSMGVAFNPEHGVDFSTLMQNAELAMFYQKDHGKDGFMIYDVTMYEKTLRFMQMANQLKEAVINNEFLLYYQPQYDLATGQLIGLEALIRWNHPQKGFIPPMEFIPFSEETGHIVPISEWVLKTAYKQKKEWEQMGYQPVKVSINLSGYIITKPSAMERIFAIIESLDLKHGELEVEVTETAVMMELDKAKDSLSRLKEMGVLIALDDFGTGYSSLTYLQRLPFDILKIDREFIKNVEDENEEIYIFKTIVDLAHKMDLDVVAEGVETKEQKEFLIKNNCDIGQGYYFCKPSPASVIENILKK